MRTHATAASWALGAMALGCSPPLAQPVAPSSPAPVTASTTPEAPAAAKWLHLPITGLSAPTKASPGSVVSSRARGYAIDELRVGATTVLVWPEHDITPEFAVAYFEEGALDSETASVTVLDDGVLGIYERQGFTTVEVFRVIDGQPIHCEGKTSAQTRAARAKDGENILHVCQSLRSDGASTAEYWLSPLRLVILGPKGSELTNYPMSARHGEDFSTLQIPGFTLSIRRRMPRREASDAPEYDGHFVTTLEHGFEFTVPDAAPPKFSGYYDVGDTQFKCVLERAEATTKLSDVRDVCRSLRPDGTAETEGGAKGRRSSSH